MGLTVVTLVFGELIPKSLGVSNAEMVARIMVRFAVCICLSTCLCMRVHICMPHNAPHPPFPTFTRPHSTTTYPHTPTNKPKINTRCRPSTSWPWCSPPWGRFCPCSPSSSSASSGSRSVNFRSYLYTYTMPSSTPTPPTHPQPPQHPPVYCVYTGRRRRARLRGPAPPAGGGRPEVGRDRGAGGADDQPGLEHAGAFLK